MKNMINILDCTLRDGGYVNDWRFSEKSVIDITRCLEESGIDLIEAGYLSEKYPQEKGRTIFSSLQDIEEIVPKHILCRVACMINYGEYAAEHLPDYNGFGIRYLRIAFHQEDMRAALNYCRELCQKGYEVFVQPMSTIDYSEEELTAMLSVANEIGVRAVYIVDSFGFMQPHDVELLLNLYQNNLKKDIAIGFHSHNNLQLSMSNSEVMLNHRDKGREIIIDSSVFGMGRGAGNLCTELLIKHLNEHFDKSYELLPVLEIIDDYLHGIFIRTPWGYSLPYYLASSNKCHPNYATYLSQKQTIGIQQMNKILGRIPQENRRKFDKELIERLYIEYTGVEIDDRETLHALEKVFNGKSLLLLAPGKSLQEYEQQIRNYVTEQNPIVIAINFVPKQFALDVLFLSNPKRKASVKQINSSRILTTSNITDVESRWKVNYFSLVNYSEQEADNAGLMLLRLLIKLKVKEVAMAGFDGFSQDPHQNYYDEQYINSTVTEVFESRNRSVGHQLAQLMKSININFLTPTRYV